MVAVEHIVAHILINERKTVAEIILHRLIVHGNAVELVDIDGHGLLLPQPQHQIPVHVVQVVGNALLHLFLFP